MKKILKKMAIVLLFIVALYSLGVISSAVSLKSCENKLAHWIFNGHAKGKPFRIPTRHAEPYTLEIFDRNNAKYFVGNPKNNEVPRYPWGYVKKARSKGPFIVSVEQGVMLGRLHGTGTRVRFLCFFGLVLFLDEEMIWNS